MPNPSRCSTSETIRRAAVVLAVSATAVFGSSVAAQGNPTIPGSTTGPGGSIWLPNYSQGYVTKFNAETFAVEKQIRNVGDHPMVTKALPDGSRLFVGNFGPGNPLTWNISVIDMPSEQVIKRIPTLGAPWATIIMSKDTRYLFVPTNLSVVQVIDTSTLEIVRTIPVLLPPGIAHIELSPDGTIMYAMAAGLVLSKYDTTTGALLAPPLFLNGFTAGWGAISEDGNTLYAVNFWAGVAIVDLRSWTVRTTAFVHFWSEPLSATLTPDGKELWICLYNSNEIVVIDAETGAEKRRLPTGDAPVYVGFSRDGKVAYLSTVTDGIPLPYFNPLVGWYHAKQQAWDPFMANLANLDTSLVAYDTTTMQRLRSYTTKGAYIAGVYPD